MCTLGLHCSILVHNLKVHRGRDESSERGGGMPPPPPILFPKCTPDFYVIYKTVR